MFLFLLGYVLFFWRWEKNKQNFYPKGRPFLFGHRGSPTYITENTVSSFEKAIKQGVDGLEFDIRLSRDRKIIIFHDRNLKRLTGKNQQIKNLTAKELKEINLDQNEQIPLLEEIIPLIEKTKAVNIEIKSDGIFKGHGIISPLIRFLDQYKIDNKTLYLFLNYLNTLIVD